MKKDIKRIIDTLQRSDNRHPIMLFNELKQSKLLCSAFLGANLKGLVNCDWESVENKMMNNQFLSDYGFGFIRAPYRVWRPGVENKLSTIFFKKASIPIFPVNQDLLNERYGVFEKMEILPIDILYCSGNIGGEKGENFIVPNGWYTMPEASSGKPLLDIQGAQKKLNKLATDKYLKSLFDQETSSAFIRFRNDTTRIHKARFWEYSTHEMGHAQGNFSDRIKSIKGFMHLAAFEEWRADGIMADIVSLHVNSGDINEAEGRDILMSNFLTRFGTDMARNNGKLDHDLLTSFWVLLSLEKTGSLSFGTKEICLNGDLESFSFWQGLYSELQRSAMEASLRLNDKEFDPIKDSIPESAIELEDFINLAKKVSSKNSLTKNNKLVRK